MKPVARTLMPWLGALLLAGCGVQLEVAEEAEPKGTEFSKSLYEGYLQLSRDEYAEGDYRDSDTFAERAITAADGAAPPPESLESRSLPANAVSLLAEARDRLLARSISACTPSGIRQGCRYRTLHSLLISISTFR